MYDVSNTYSHNTWNTFMRLKILIRLEITFNGLNVMYVK